MYEYVCMQYRKQDSKQQWNSLSLSPYFTRTMTENKWSIWHEIQLQFRTAAFTPFFCCVTHSQPKLTLITEMGLPFLKRKPVRCYHLRFIRHLFMYHMHMGVSRISVWRGIMMIFSKNWGTFSEKKTVRSWVRINWKWRAEKRPPCPVGRFKSVLSHKSMKWICSTRLSFLFKLLNLCGYWISWA